MEDSDPLEELLIQDGFYSAPLKQNSKANFFDNNFLFSNCCLFVLNTGKSLVVGLDEELFLFDFLKTQFGHS